MRGGGRVELSAVPVSFNANNLLGEALSNRADDPLQHRQLSWLQLVSPGNEHIVRGEFNSNYIAVQASLSAGDVDSVSYTHLTLPTIYSV